MIGYASLSGSTRLDVIHTPSSEIRPNEDVIASFVTYLCPVLLDENLGNRNRGSGSGN